MRVAGSIRAFAGTCAAVLAIAGACLLIPAEHAFAEDLSTGWDVTYNAEGKMVSDYDQAKVNAALGSLLPGDNLTITVNLRNKNAQTTEWYMASSVLKTLEEAEKEVKAENGAYQYSLLYNGNEIYRSDRVGGDGSQGLKEISNATGTWFWLGTLAKDQFGVAQIKMSLDGETQGNAYMKTIGKLKVRFAVEYPGGSATTVVDEPEPSKNVAGMPQTGDPMLVAVLGLLATVALCAMALRLSAARKRTRREG